ncbi:MAG: histidine phosphatase family protein [Euzebyales bacterium]|nr:histidine phosphatase family protein [Euzebyales bacterium]
MTTLLLIRHATTASTGTRLGGRTEAGLDEGGRAQAEAAAGRLAEVPLKAVYASPLPRTMQTAWAVAGPHRLVVQPDESLLEVEYGRWTDRPLASLTRTKVWPVIQARPSLVGFPEGETIRAAQLRAVDGLQRIVARHPRDAVAAVSHADVIKAVVAFYLGLPLDLFQRLHVSPASATVLSLPAPAGQPALLRFNDDGPLQLARPGRRAKKATSRASTKAAAKATARTRRHG